VIFLLIAVAAATSWPTAILALATAALAGGGVSTIIIRRMDRKSLDLNVFYPTWQKEMQRIHQELASLRAQVHLLSDEVRRLGGDPLAVRYKADTTAPVPPEFAIPEPNPEDPT